MIPDFAAITEPLRELTRKSAKWQWTDCQQSAFDIIKGFLASNPALAFFDSNKSSELIVDASPYGSSGIPRVDRYVYFSGPIFVYEIH